MPGDRPYSNWHSTLQQVHNTRRLLPKLYRSVDVLALDDVGHSFGVFDGGGAVVEEVFDQVVGVTLLEVGDVAGEALEILGGDVGGELDEVGGGDGEQSANVAVVEQG